MQYTYSGKVYRDPSGRRTNAKDIAERLLPDLNMNELALWSPDLFAYTSYLMSVTGAYQLVVSPPKGKSWMPSNGEILEWLGIKVDRGFTENSTEVLKANVTEWLKSFVRISSDEQTYQFLEPEEKEKWGLKDNLIAFAEGEISLEEFRDTSNKTLIIEGKNSLEEYKAAAAELKDAFDAEIEKLADRIAQGVVASFHYRTDIKDLPDNKEAIYLDKKYLDKDGKPKIKREYLGNLFIYEHERNWEQFIQGLGDMWNRKLFSIEDEEFYLINDAELNSRGNPIFEDGKFIQWKRQMPKNGVNKTYSEEPENKTREELLLGILFKYTPPLLIACWAFFHNEITRKDEDGYEMPILKLLCNRDDIQRNQPACYKFWKIAQSLITMHAVADICCTGWGLRTINDEDADGKKNNALWFAEKLLFEKGSFSTINPGRGRVMPKRHNPGVGITLRSISSNLGFHRSSVEVVWRKTKKTTVESEIKKKGDTFSLLLLPFPLDIRAKDFNRDVEAEKSLNFDQNEYGFFEYRTEEKINSKRIIELINRAGDELKTDRVVDMIVFPEDALSKTDYESLEKDMEKTLGDTSPSLFVSGIRESRGNIYLDLYASDEEKKKYKEAKEKLEEAKENLETARTEGLDGIELKKFKEEVKRRKEVITSLDEKFEEEGKKSVNFARNAVYCKYYDTNPNQKTYSYKPQKNKLDGDDDVDNYPPNQTPKYKQYKHHRWRLDSSQIIRYGLSQTLDEGKVWWEAIKVPKRRVSFLNIGNRITISTLVCEDLARQDPIADLIRHVGPSLVVTLLMDGPQVKSRWSGRYASILSDDPGSSVIALTSLGMVKRDTTFGLSRVVGLWSESSGKKIQEIGLAEGAEAVLLILKLDEVNEKTADGREERESTSVLKLLDVIQIYPENKS